MGNGASHNTCTGNNHNYWAMEGTTQFYQCTCGDQFRPFTHSWYGREPTVQQDYHIWSENTTKPREESREENFTDSSDTGRCGNPDGRPSIDWDVFMPWSSIADPEDLKRLSELPLSPYASCAEEEEREAGRPRRLRPRTAPVRLRAGGPLAKPPTPSAPGRCSVDL
ncbi:Protein of unknown function [Gryllus bimaculatus]|nr:Protein of unknown function [Gryllus bimaculatus]